MLRSDRYRQERITSESLKGNPIGSPYERTLSVYLPPEYYTSGERYPVVYLLHGYGGHSRNLTLFRRPDEKSFGHMTDGLRKFLKYFDLGRLPSFELLDELISGGKMKPFILVQPDASLHIPNKYNTREALTGTVSLKGSFYIDSPYSGNFETYIVKDVIDYVDHTFRTEAKREKRCLTGGSMGGYGTLRICLNNPGLFVSAAALSPANLVLSGLGHKLVIPYITDLLGREESERQGFCLWDDIIETFDMTVCGGDRLISSLSPDGGVISSHSETAKEKWSENDINAMIAEKPDALKEMSLLLNCAANDEFGLAERTVEMHETLLKHRISHEYSIYSDGGISFSPHIFGICYNTVPAIDFCLRSV